MHLLGHEHNYTLLTIGDGLVAQIPSLLLSTGTAIIVTRMSAPQDMGEQVIGQLFQKPKVLAVSASVLVVLGITPGMPIDQKKTLVHRFSELFASGDYFKSFCFYAFMVLFVFPNGA